MSKIAQNLTELAIKKLKPTKKRKVNGDIYFEIVRAIGYGIPGLSIRVTERRKTFRCRYKLNGKASLCTIGDYPALGLEEALTAGRELR